MQKSLALLAVFCLSGCANVLNANESENQVSLLDLPFGEQRSTVLPMAEAQWGSQATCDTMRTGVGLSRRAYFLETCVLSNQRGNTLYNETTTTAVYRFLENQLVQVAYEFAHVSDPDTFILDAQQSAEKLDQKHSESSDTNKQSISVSEDFRVTVSDVDMVDQIHALRDAP